MAKVSIIVPVYKVENYIRRCVDSLIQQTLRDIEIILIDDGSPDNCPQICDEYAEKDQRITVIHKKNGGVSAARNDGLKQATGNYVIFCDSDDWMEIEGCERLYKAADVNNADVTIGDVYMAYEKKEKKLVHFYNEEFTTKDRRFIKKMIQGDIYRTYSPCPPKEGYAFGYGGPWNKLVKRSLLINNDIQFDLNVKGVFDDILYTAYILANAEKVCYVKNPIYNYRILDNSITHSYKPNVIEINDAIFKAWSDFLEEHDSEENFKNAFYACVLRRIEESIKLYYINSKNPKSKKALIKEYKKMIKKEPYSNAIKNVELKKISKKQKLIAILGCTRLSSVLWSIYKES